MRQRRGDLRLGDRRGDVVELGVGEITQIAERRGAVARQHVERIGEIAPAVLGRVRRVADEVAQPVERELERDVGHRKALLPRARQEVGDVGVEPGVVAAEPHRPNEPFEHWRASRRSIESRMRWSTASSSARCAALASSLT